MTDIQSLNPTQYQNEIYNLLLEKFTNIIQDISKEWHAFKGKPSQYSPRVDIALGPFSIKAGETKEGVYNLLVKADPINSFLNVLYLHHLKNIRSLISVRDLEIIFEPFEQIIEKNQNARCLLAIEIECKNSKKHMIGSIVNAASLGRVGIGIADNESAKKTFIRILNYLAFLKRVEKNSYDTTNFFVVTKQQFYDALHSLQSPNLVVQDVPRAS